MTGEEEAFLASIEAAPLDEAPHKVFADWLDEHDRPEEAIWHRAWTTADAKAAHKWLEDLASQHFEPYKYDGPMSAATIIEAAKEWLRQKANGEEWPERYVQQGSDSLRDDVFANDYSRKEFWRNFEKIIGLPLSNEILEEGRPFCCTC